MFNDSREPLIEVAIQLLIVVLDYDMEQQQIIDNVNNLDTSYEVYYKLKSILFKCTLFFTTIWKPLLRELVQLR